MHASKKKQNKMQKRILIASLAVASILVIGGTFAWFTSQDSVTNRLTAASDYGVSITETFTPPEDWVPGQEINKDVGAVNTGNISAFVKLTLSNKLNVTYETTAASRDTAGITLDTGVNGTDEANEVLAVQAGGILVSAPSTSNATLGKLATYYNATPNNTTTNVSPDANGLYIFRHATENGGYAYKGFYYDNGTYYKINVTSKTEPTYGDDGNTVTDANNDGTADTSAGASAEFTVAYAVEADVTDETPMLTFEEAKGITPYTTPHTNDSHPARIVATYQGADASSDDDNIIIYINLADNALTNWTNGGLNTGNTEAYFFLNQLLEPGESSENLVDSVELSQYVKKEAYRALTYDLNIGLSSVQAVYKQDTDGTTTIDAANSAVSAQTLLESYGGSEALTTATVSDTKANSVAGTVKWSK